jgi:hypothetical protein
MKSTSTFSGDTLVPHMAKTTSPGVPPFRRPTNPSVIPFGGAESLDTHKLHVDNNRRPRKDTILFSAISASGTYTVLVTKKDFRIFRNLPVPSLVFIGEAKKRKYQYGAQEDRIHLQTPLPSANIDLSAFSSIALSDEYLAVAAEREILIFKASGWQAGRWLVCDKVQNGSILGLTFSSDGSQLVAVCSVSGSQGYDGARIYHTIEFAPTAERSEVLSSQHLMHMKEVTWPRDYVHKARCMAFSSRGDMVAISTSHSKGQAEIKMLRLVSGGWSYWGETLVVVLDAENPKEMRGAGITGIAL